MATDRHKQYKEQYTEAKRGGEPFYPDTVFRDVVMALIVFAIVIAFAILFGAPTESVANPTDTTYNPRPEWYFFFLFQMLKYFPGSLEPVAAVVIPSVVIIVLILLP